MNILYQFKPSSINEPYNLHVANNEVSNIILRAIMVTMASSLMWAVSPGKSWDSVSSSAHDALNTTDSCSAWWDNYICGEGSLHRGMCLPCVAGSIVQANSATRITANGQNMCFFIVMTTVRFNGAQQWLIQNSNTFFLYNFWLRRKVMRSYYERYSKIACSSLIEPASTEFNLGKSIISFL